MSTDRGAGDIRAMPGLLSSLRAFVWLRWRLLVNSLHGGRKRDRMEQISRIFALFVPLMLAALSFGSVVAIAIAGAVAGRAVATALVTPDSMVLIMRMALFGAVILLAIVTVVSPHQSSTARYTRLVLLPIRRQTLHLVEVLSGMADPVVAFIVPGLLLFAAALAVYGRPAAGFWAFAAAAGLVFVLTALAGLISFLVAWLLRSRRRGEMFTLVFVLGISLISFIPAFFGERLEQRARARAPGEKRPPFSVVEFDRRLPSWSRALPSELYGFAVRDGLAGHSSRAGFAVLLLFVQGAVLYAASSRVHRELLTALEGDRARRRNASARSALGRLPLMGPASSAVAWAQVRTGLRSVRGRLLVLLPGPMMAMITLLFRQMGSDDRFAATLASNGHLIVGAGGLFCLYAMQALTMNMFGSDRAGLTLQFLSPIGDRQLAHGKIAGCGIIFGVGLALSVGTALLVAANSPAALWIAVVLGLFAAFVLLSPVYVWLSALFPVASDLSRTGSGGNPHPLPMFAGIFCTMLCAGPSALILFISQFLLERVVLAPILMAGWLFVAVGLSLPFVSIASRAIDQRRENLALVAQGK
jgi:hypothetical protein